VGEIRDRKGSREKRPSRFAREKPSPGFLDAGFVGLAVLSGLIGGLALSGALTETGEGRMGVLILCVIGSPLSMLGVICGLCSLARASSDALPSVLRWGGVALLSLPWLAFGVLMARS
jgi:hypothetical protein